MKLFEAKFSIQKSEAKLTMSGALSGDAQMPEIDLNGCRRVIIDLEEVDYINSAGVKQWMLWVWGLDEKYPTVDIALNAVSTAIVRQIISISKFMPERSMVLSVFLPFYCEKCEAVRDQLFVLNKELAEPTAFSNQTSPCSCGWEMELDMSPRAVRTLIKNFGPGRKEMYDSI